MSLHKANFNNDIRRIQLPESPEFADLVAELSSKYSLSNFTIKYLDDEGDFVTIASDADLAVAIDASRNGKLRLDVSLSNYSDPDVEESPTVSETDYLGRFDVHYDAECYGCDSEPIVGTRYRCTTSPQFDLCGTCMKNNMVNTTGLKFRAINFPWQADDSKRKVPSGTLKPGMRSIDASMLQKALTDIGYMTPDMYSQGVGTYGPNTARAVKRFRKNYGLDHYDETVAATLRSVLDGKLPLVNAAGTDENDADASDLSDTDSSSSYED